MKPLVLTAMHKRRFSVLLIIVLLLGCSGSALSEKLQDCHRCTNTYVDTKQENKSVVRLWHIETAHDEVTNEINNIAEGFAEQFAPTLQKQTNAAKKNSRLDVEIRYSRTGLTWMSFLVQARTIYHQKLIDQVFDTRTYDMITGERILMSDLFDYDSYAWEMLGNAVREQLTAYFPDVEPDPGRLNYLCTREALEQADFTLHGMSLVLHYPASLLYTSKNTMMEVTVFYPAIRDFMTEQAFIETDNLRYYRTCALTFDDGPSGSNSAKVLNSLMETGSRATFFVIGNRIADYQYIVQREHDNGHAVASHNWHHGNATKSSGSALRAMPEKVNKAMIKAIGIPVRYDRVPGGRYPAMIKAGVGWAYIQWSLDTYDWRGGSTSGVMSKVKKQLSDGDIILCHDIKDNTPESTRQICNYIAEQGYMLLTIDELFAKDGVELQPKKVYYRCTDGDTSIKN